MLFFAVGSKVAAYHSKELAARSMAATKVWQARNAAVDSEAVSPVAVLQTAVELVVLFSLYLALAGPPVKLECPPSDSLIESFAALAMRPPPLF